MDLDEDYDQNYDDVDTTQNLNTNAPIESNQLLLQQQQQQEQYQMQYQMIPPQPRTSSPMMGVSPNNGISQSNPSQSLFRPSPLSNLIIQQQKQRTQPNIQSQQSPTHFLPLGRGKYFC